MRKIRPFGSVFIDFQYPLPGVCLQNMVVVRSCINGVIFRRKFSAVVINVIAEIDKTVVIVGASDGSIEAITDIVNIRCDMANGK